MPILLLLFILMPIVEIAVLIQVGSAIGALSTIAIVVLTAILGTVMLRQQGLSTLARARQRLDAGEMPALQLVEGLLLLVGGVLLLTPGFVTDAIGFACLIPFTRRWLANRVASRSVIGMAGVTIGSAGAQPGRPGQPGQPGTTHTPPGGTPNRNDVIDGDYRRVD